MDKPYHANVVAVQQDLGQLRRVPIVAAASLSQHTWALPGAGMSLLGLEPHNSVTSSRTMSVASRVSVESSEIVR